MEILKKIQNQPAQTRKIIFWIIMVLIGFALIFAWVQSFQQRMREARERKPFRELTPPDFSEQFETLPQVQIPEIPDLSEEELLKLEEELKKESQ